MTEQEINDILKGAVIVLGAPRSGTSVLGRIFESHPNVVHIKEPRLVWRYGNDRLSDILTEEHARPEVIAYIRKRFAEWVKSEGGGVMVEKTPSNSLRVEFIAKIMPEAKFVHVIRNGYDSVLSIRNYWKNFTSGISYDRTGSKTSVLQQRIAEMHLSQVPFYAWEFLIRALPLPRSLKPVLWGPRLPGMSSMRNELSTLEVAALQWRTCVECACIAGSSLNAERYFELRLEDLCEAKLKELFRFSGLDYHPDVEAYFSENFNSGFASRQTKSADPEDIRIVRKWIEPTAKWLEGRC